MIELAKEIWWYCGLIVLAAASVFRAFCASITLLDWSLQRLRVWGYFRAWLFKRKSFERWLDEHEPTWRDWAKNNGKEKGNG